MHTITDYIIRERWEDFTTEEHDRWKFLFDRQMTIFQGRVAQEHIDSLKRLNISADRIPKFEEISKILKEHTGFEIAAVPGLVPEDIFFKMLKNRQFPSTTFLRTPDKIDYLQEPDIFHDIFGHIPLLVIPAFADYMEAFATIALKALERSAEDVIRAARIYWFTIEFGLIRQNGGLRTYGAGIVSSYKETIYCVEDPKPIRTQFDLARVMRTDYRIDDLQKNYFVIDSYEELFNATLQDHTALLDSLQKLPLIPAGTMIEGEENIPANTPL